MPKTPPTPSKPIHPIKLSTWTPPRLTPWQRDALEQGYFDFAIPRFESVTPIQAARALSLHVTSIYNLRDEGLLETRSKAITGNVEQFVITRRSLLLYAASKWQLSPKDLEERAVEFIRAINSRPLLQRLHAEIGRELERVPNPPPHNLGGYL